MFIKRFIKHGSCSRQLLVDISELVQSDARTGIQRVVRSILREWLINPPDGFRVKPVYASIGQPYRYAHRFTNNFIGTSSWRCKDNQVVISSGDYFIGLDLAPQVQYEKSEYYQSLRCKGVIVKFIVYDLLCIKYPHLFSEGVAEGFLNWLNVTCRSDGVVCISKSVASDYYEWVKNIKPAQKEQFCIEWNHLGSNFEEYPPALELSEKYKNILESISKERNFLMVGTIEPRKAHLQVLEAFELLWNMNFKINLIIVGKQGWMVTQFVSRLLAHPWLNKRLFWFEGISDDILEKIYVKCDCLIAASYDEGFGLPLIEAAHRGLPIIARDIQVFREVAGGHASFFKSDTADGLAALIRSWLSLYEKGLHPKSFGLSCLSWKESAKLLACKITNSHKSLNGENQ